MLQKFNPQIKLVYYSHMIPPDITACENLTHKLLPSFKIQAPPAKIEHCKTPTNDTVDVNRMFTKSFTEHVSISDQQIREHELVTCWRITMF